MREWRKKVLGDRGIEYLVTWGPRYDREWRWACVCPHFRYRRPETCKHIERAKRLWGREMIETKKPNLGEMIRGAQAQGLQKIHCDALVKISTGEETGPAHVRCLVVWKDGTEVALLATGPSLEVAQVKAVSYALACHAPHTTAVTSKPPPRKPP